MAGISLATVIQLHLTAYRMLGLFPISRRRQTFNFLWCSPMSLLSIACGAISVAVQIQKVHGSLLSDKNERFSEQVITRSWFWVSAASAMTYRLTGILSAPQLINLVKRLDRKEKYMVKSDMTLQQILVILALLTGHAGNFAIAVGSIIEAVFKPSSFYNNAALNPLGYLLGLFSDTFFTLTAIMFSVTLPTLVAMHLVEEVNRITKECVSYLIETSYEMSSMKGTSGIQIQLYTDCCLDRLAKRLYATTSQFGLILRSVEKISLCFGASILCLLISTSIILCGCIPSVTYLQQRKYLTTRLFITVVSRPGFFMLYLFALSYSCHAFENQIQESQRQFQYMLSKQLPLLTAADDRVLKMVEKHVEYMLNNSNNFRFTASGLLAVNIELIPTMFALAMTYGIFILQLQLGGY